VKLDPTANGYQAMKDSILGPSGGQLTEVAMDSDGNMAWSHTNVWVGGQLLATYDPNGLHFYLTDWTGSRRVQTDYEGVVEQTCTNLPYGDGVSCGPTPSEELYAGLDRDPESGLDHAMFRQYSSTFGQWTSPDPYGGSSSVYNPQSLNRYAYVNGSPLGAADRSGLDPILGLGLAYSGAAPVAASSSFLTTLLGDIGNVLGPIGVFADAGEAIADIGQSLGWWSFGPTFRGNTAASQSGKYVPNAPQSQKDGFADCGCLAGQMGIFHSPQAVQTWGNANTGVMQVAKIKASVYGFVLSGLPAAAGLGATGIGGSAELTTLGLENPSTTAMLEAHVETAVELADEQGLSAAQDAAGQGMEAANRGTNIHNIARQLVEEDPLLGNISTSGPGQFGPDFYSVQTGQWWDITTPGQWLAHVAKYTAAFGEGTFLGY
jgi:RHS repeat-associated protein